MMYSLWLGPAACCQAVSADCQDMLGAMATALPGGGRRSVAERSTHHTPGWHKCAIPTCPTLTATWAWLPHPPPSRQQPGKKHMHLHMLLRTVYAQQVFTVAASTPAAAPCPPNLGLLISTMRVTVVSIHPGGSLGPSLLIYFCQGPHRCLGHLERLKRGLHLS